MIAILLSGVTERYCVGFNEDVDRRLISIIDKSLACISNEEITEMIVKDTIIYKSISIVDILYQNPIESILIIIAFFVFVILVLLIIEHNKSNYAKKIF